MEPNTLRVRRAERRWSQTTAARAAGLPFSRYRHIEIGDREPTDQEIAAIERAFSVSRDLLFAPLVPPFASTPSPAPAD